MAYTSDQYYVEPWSAWDLNLREFYVPTLIMEFMERSYLSQMVPLKVDLGAVSTKKMIWTGIYPLEPSWNAIDDVSWWVDRMYPAGYRIEVGMETYGSGLGLHKYHDLVTYWKNGGGTDALRRITGEYVADSIVREIEQLVLNAHLTKPHGFIVGHDYSAGVAAITSSDVYDTTLADKIGLDFEYMQRSKPGEIPTMACFLSPGQAQAIRKSEELIEVSRYTETGFKNIMNWEIGGIPGVGRFMRHPINTLYNAGTLVACAPVTAAINPGDGGQDPASYTVDGARRVGQENVPGTKRYIQLDQTANWLVGSDMALFRVGDIITIYTVPSPGTDALWNVANAPLPSDGTISYRQITAVDTGNRRISVDRPVQKPYTAEVDTGVYAYVARGLHLHVAIHVNRPGGVVGCYAQPPTLHYPIAYDDREAQFRVTWDGVFGYRLFQPENFYVVLSSGLVSMRSYSGYGNET